MLGAFSAYFLTNEAKQISQGGLSYLASIWNYIDLIPPIGIFVTIVLDIYDQKTGGNDALLATIIAIVSFFMWFKFLYFLRIFKNTGYLIRMIIQVCYDMRHFFLVLLITIIAFSDSFLSLSLANTSDETQFVKTLPESIVYTYRLILGDWDTENFGEVSTLLVWTLFLLCTIFNMIVMLNLLIAIISESFAQVTANSENAQYQEMAALISENAYLIPQWEKDAYAQKDRLILAVSNLAADDKEAGESIA